MPLSGPAVRPLTAHEKITLSATPQFSCSHYLLDPRFRDRHSTELGRSRPASCPIGCSCSGKFENRTVWPSHRRNRSGTPLGDAGESRHVEGRRQGCAPLRWADLQELTRTRRALPSILRRLIHVVHLPLYGPHLSVLLSSWPSERKTNECERKMLLRDNSPPLVSKCLWGLHQGLRCLEQRLSLVLDNLEIFRETPSRAIFLPSAHPGYCGINVRTITRKLRCNKGSNRAQNQAVIPPCK